MLELRDTWLLDVFVAVVEGGSMSAAAKSKHMATPTVSESIAKLESLVGEDLLVRTSSGCHPTDRGNQVLRAAYGLIGDVNRHLAEINRSSVRPFKVGSTFGVHNSHLARLSEHPGVDLHGVSISIRNPARAVLDDVVDAGLVMGPTSHDQNLCRFYAFTEPRVGVFSRHLVEPEVKEVSLEFLDRLIWPSVPADADPVYMAPWLCADIRRGPPPRQGAAVADLLAIRDWMESARRHEMVIATTPRLAKAFADFKGLAVLPIADVPGWDVDLLTKPSNALEARDVARLLRANPPRGAYIDNSKLTPLD